MAIYRCVMCGMDRDTDYHMPYENEWGEGLLCEDCHADQLVGLEDDDDEEEEEEDDDE